MPGNELGGVPLLLNDAPLGTYLGWNVPDARPSPPLREYRKASSYLQAQTRLLLRLTPATCS